MARRVRSLHMGGIDKSMPCHMQPAVVQVRTAMKHEWQAACPIDVCEGVCVSVWNHTWTQEDGRVT